MSRPPTWLQNGFRPFFLGGALWAALAIAHWQHMLLGIGTEGSAMDPLAWHRHELIFGYGGAVITGFLLTAIPNWTRRLPIAGRPLLLLFLLWLAARIANLSSAHVGWQAAAIADMGFLWLVTGLAAREVLAGGNHKNLPVVLLVGLLATGASLSHLGLAEHGWRLGLATLVMLIAMIGGRVTPSFTRNWLAKQEGAPLPAAFDRLDAAALAMTALALAAWIAFPDAQPTGIALLLAGTGLLLRLARWQGHRTRAEPLVTILHLGYAWIGLGLALLGLDITLGPLPISAIHALTAGGVAVMTLAVMTRAILGHTGRPLHANGPTIAIYALVNLGAALRLAAPLLPMPYEGAIILAGLTWGSAFALFTLIYAPMLLRPRRQ